MKVSGAVGGSDPNNTFTVDQSYQIVVDATARTLTFDTNASPITVAWDCTDDQIQGDPATKFGIVIVNGDLSSAGVNYNGTMGTLVGAAYAPAGGIPQYAFVAP